jgi:lysozyme
MTAKTLYALLEQHEGLRLKPYDDATGKPPGNGPIKGFLTIGIGRNLTSVGISRDEARLLLKADVEKATAQAKRYKWFSTLNPVRQAVIVSMVFNMGSINSFVKMRAAIAVKNWGEAVAQMKDSKWARQIGSRRLDDLTTMMHTGKWIS